MDKTFVHIHTFAYVPEANFIKSIMQAEGIEAFLENENNIGAIPLLSNAVGGIKLHVDASDVRAALDILEKHEINTNADTSDSSMLIDLGNGLNLPGLNKFSPKSRGLILVLSILFFLLWLISRNYF